MSLVPVEHRGVSARIPTEGGGAWLAPRSSGHRLHAGVDLGGEPGTPVLAPESGRVVLVASASRPSEPRTSSPAGWSGYGPKLVVVHGDTGVFHLLAHLGAVTVARGAEVHEGDQVGTIGELSDGGHHCHWETRRQLSPTSGAATVEIAGDPAAWLAGRWEPWDGRCPPEPVDTRLTPRACRPGWEGPAPRPFRRLCRPARRPLERRAVRRAVVPCG